jgi:hypothetical protein
VALQFGSDGWVLNGRLEQRLEAAKKGKGKGKAHPRTDHEGPEGE